MHRLVVLSYHSLEDRRVKQLFRTGSPLPSATVERGREVNLEEKSSTWIELFRRARGPSEQEIAVNRRARSAKMRAAVRAPLPGELSTISIDEAKLGLGGKQKPLPLVGAKQLAKLAAADNHDDSDDDDGSEEEELPKPKVDEKKKNRHSVFTFNRRQSKVMK